MRNCLTNTKGLVKIEMQINSTKSDSDFSVVHIYRKLQEKISFLVSLDTALLIFGSVFFVLCGSNFDADPQTARIFRHSEERSFGFPSQITHRETHGETSKKTLAGAAVR